MDCEQAPRPHGTRLRNLIFIYAQRPTACEHRLRGVARRLTLQGVRPHKAVVRSPKQFYNNSQELRFWGLFSDSLSLARTKIRPGTVAVGKTSAGRVVIICICTTKIPQWDRSQGNRPLGSVVGLGLPSCLRSDGPGEFHTKRPISHSQAAVRCPVL